MKSKKIYHAIKVSNGVINFPSSVPSHLEKYVAQKKDDELESFKRQVKEKILK